MIKAIEANLPVKVNEELELRYIDNRDVKDLYEIYSNDRVARYTARKTHTSLKDTEEFLMLIDERMRAGNNLYLGVFHSDSKKLIGVIRLLMKEELTTLTIGYALNASFWGRGIIPSSLSKLFELIKDDGEPKLLRATVRPENYNSQRCLEKLGFGKTDTIMKSENVDGQEHTSERLVYTKTIG